MHTIKSIESWDATLLLTLNAHHTDWMDRFMWLMSQTAVWIPFFALFLFLLFRNQKGNALIVLLFLALLVLCTDQVASGIFKPLVARFRPTHTPGLEEHVHLVNGYRGGHYGFFSSHAANVFGFAVLSLLLVRRTVYTLTIIAWASLVSFSRIYLGVHFPLDVATGVLFGVLAGVGFYYLYLVFTKKPVRKRGKFNQKRSRKSEGILSESHALWLSFGLLFTVANALIAAHSLCW
jgi:undecaprenyl-diphosphatase